MITINKILNDESVITAIKNNNDYKKSYELIKDIDFSGFLFKKDDFFNSLFKQIECVRFKKLNAKKWDLLVIAYFLLWQIKEVLVKKGLINELPIL